MKSTTASNNVPDEALDHLAKAHVATVDALTGYITMVEKAESDFRPVVEAFRKMHAQHADTLAQHLKNLGREPDTDGSFMGTINKAVVTMRAVFDDIDDDTMDSIRNGEEHVLETYHEATETALPSAVLTDLRRLSDEINAQIEQTRDID